MESDYKLLKNLCIGAAILGIIAGLLKPVPEYDYPPNSHFPPPQCYEKNGSLMCDNGPQEEVRERSIKWERK